MVSDYVPGRRLSTTVTINGLTQYIVTATNDELHVYADGDNGNDDNSGLSLSAAKKTVQAAVNVVPSYIKHNVCVHLTGSFVDQGDVTITKTIEENKYLIIDGGDDLTNVLGPIVADISSTNTVGNTGLGMTTDQYSGYYIEILDGTCAGQIRQIMEHTSTTFTVAKTFTANPTACTFRLVKPATTISNTTGVFSSFRFSGCVGSGYIRFQRLTITGKIGVYLLYNIPQMAISAINFEGTHSFYLSILHNDNVNLSYLLYDPDTFILVPNTSKVMGIIQSSSIAIAAQRNNLMYVSGYYKKFSSIESRLSFEVFRSNGTITLQNPKYGSYMTRVSSTFYPATVSTSTGVGISMEGGFFEIKAYSNIKDNTSHGITVRNGGSLYVSGIAIGANNGGTGVYLSEGSRLTMAHGYPPTISGSLGMISLDGTTEASTWAALDAGTPINALTPNNNEFVVAKELV